MGLLPALLGAADDTAAGVPALGSTHVSLLHRQLARLNMEVKVSVASAQLMFVALGRNLMWASAKEVQLAVGADLALHVSRDQAGELNPPLSESAQLVYCRWRVGDVHVRDMHAAPQHTFVVKSASVGGHVSVEGAADVTLDGGPPAVRVHVDNMQVLVLSRFAMDLIFAVENLLKVVLPYHAALCDLLGVAHVGNVPPSLFDLATSCGPVWEPMVAVFAVVKLHVQATRMRVVVPTMSKSKEGLVGEWKEIYVGSNAVGGEEAGRKLILQAEEADAVHVEYLMAQGRGGG